MFVVVHRKVDALSRPERCLGFFIPLPNLRMGLSIGAVTQHDDLVRDRRVAYLVVLYEKKYESALRIAHFGDNG